jgi:hypothetical protein
VGIETKRMQFAIVYSNCFTPNHQLNIEDGQLEITKRGSMMKARKYAVIVFQIPLGCPDL